MNNAWDTITDHLGWIVSGAAAVAGYLFRRRGQHTSAPIGERLSPSRIGRWLNAVKENERLRADLGKADDSLKRQEDDLADMQASIARREATWQTERAEMEAYAARIRAEANELAQLVATLRTVQAGASSVFSATPSPNSTVSVAMSSPPLPRPSG